MTVEDRLRRAVPPDAEGAEQRAWAVVEQAAPARVTKPTNTVGFVTRWGAAIALATLFALSGAGAATGEWVADRIAPEPRTPKLAATLPTSGRLLVQDARGLVVIRQDGGRTKLPAADGATWSPHGLFIAAWTGSELRAMEPDGDPRWRITAPARITNAAWSPDGLRIAYIAGNRVHIVSGNGANDHALIGGVTREAHLAWNPERPQELAYGKAAARDVGTGQRVQRTWRERRATIDDNTLRVNGRALLTVRGLRGTPVWSPDGRYLAVGRGRSILLTSADGTRLSTIAGGVPLGWAPLARP